MRPWNLKPQTFARARRLLLLVVAVGLLAGCETTGDGASKTEAAKPAEPPMTHSRAAMECWMNTEKGSAGKDLDKRADTVNKCIDDKMKAAKDAPAAPKT